MFTNIHCRSFLKLNINTHYYITIQFNSHSRSQFPKVRQCVSDVGYGNYCLAHEEFKQVTHTEIKLLLEPHTLSRQGDNCPLSKLNKCLCSNVQNKVGLLIVNLTYSPSD